MADLRDLIAQRLTTDELHAVPGYTPNWLVRQNMREYIDLMEEAVALMRDMWPWVWESGIKDDEFYAMAERLREFGIGDDDDD